MAKKKGPGAPKNNANALRAGKYHFLSTGKMPTGANYVGRQANQLRRAIEAAVIERHGEISLPQAGLIQSCVRHEIRSQLVQRWLRIEFDNLTVEQRLAHIKEVGAASDSRDKALAKLDLDRPIDNPFDQLGSVIESLSPPAD